MKKSIIITMLFLAVGFGQKNTGNIKVLALVPNYYGANYYLVMDNFERFGWDVTTAGVRTLLQPCASYAGPLGCPPITPDYQVSDITTITDYSAVVIMSGSWWTNQNPCYDLMTSSETLQLLQSASDSGLVIAGMCTGVRVPGAAGLLNGRNVTGSHRYATEFTNAGATWLGRNHYPVIDSNIVTAAAGDFWNIENANSISTAIHQMGSGLTTPPDGAEPNLVQNNTVLTGDIFMTTIGSSASEGGNSIAAAQDGGFIIAGYTFSSGSGGADVLLIKVDSTGAVEWSKAYGGANDDYGNDVAVTNDGGYIVGGFTRSYGQGNEDLFIIRTDSEGNELWRKQYGGNGTDIGETVLAHSSGVYVIAGSTDSFGNGQNDAYYLVLDEQGDTLYSGVYGSQHSEFLKDAIELSSGNILLTGTYGFFNSQNVGDRSIQLLSIDPTGNVLWNRKIGETGFHNWGFAAAEMPGGGYHVTGNADSIYNDLYQLYSIAIDTNGYYQWRTRYGESTLYDYGRSIEYLPDGGYVLSGTTKSVSNGNDVYFLQFDEQRNVVKKLVIGESGADWGSDGCLSADSQYYWVTGYTNSAGEGAYDVLLLKIPLAGTVNDSDDSSFQPEQFKLYQNYPNPFNPSTAIQFDLKNSAEVRLDVASIDGKIVSTLLHNRLDAGTHLVEFNGKDAKGNHLASGIYLYRLTVNNKFTQTRKMLLIK